MIRIFLIVILLLFNFSSGSNIDTKITKNKKVLSSKKKQNLKTKVKIKLLAKQINSATKKFKNIEKKINKVDKKIKNNTSKLTKTKNQLKLLELKSDQIIDKKEKTQLNLVESMIENHSSTIAIGLASQHTLDEIIDSYVYTLLAYNSKVEIQKLDQQYKSIIKNQHTNKEEINKLKIFIKSDKSDKSELKKLEDEYSETLTNLGKKHKTYQKELKKIIVKQQKLSSLLGKLNILKKKEISSKKQKLKLKKLQAKKKKTKTTIKKTTSKKQIQSSKNFNKQLSMDVRSIGSSTSGIKTTRYKGTKTIAPLKKYSINKKFGKSYDKVYKIELFNDSIEMKTKEQNAKVYSVLSGKVVYSKKNSGLLENVVIVKHKNNLHTIYSHLDQIAPTIRKGKWVQKGSVLGRVDDTLTFQATKNNKYINPKELFR